MNRYEELRSGWALALGVLLAGGLLLGSNLLLGALLAGSYEAIVAKPIGYTVLETTANLLQEASMVVGGLLAFYIATKRGARQMGFNTLRLAKNLLHGVLSGGAAITLVFGLLVVTGQVEVLAFNTSAFASFSWWNRLLFYVMVGIGEEALSRGFMMTALKTTRNRFVVVLLPAFLFSLMHLANPSFALLPMVNIFLAGVYFALLFVRTGSLWAPIAGHFVWNWLQGSVYGLNVSGLAQVSLLECDLAEGGFWLHGGAFGAEGGLVTTAVLLGAIALYLFVVKTPADAPWTLESDLPFTRRAAPYLRGAAGAEKKKAKK